MSRPVHRSPAEPASRGPAGRRRMSPLLLGGVIAAAGLVLGGIATAAAKGPGHPAPPTAATPRHGDAIPNVTTVENQIKAYYDDTVSGTTPENTANHVPSPDGNYAHEVEGIAGQAQNQLAGALHGNKHGDRPALVFDVDDTTLNTYNYEIFSQFGYNPTTNADFVNAEAFPAVFGMPGLETWADSHGYTVFYITGRPESQRGHTVGNLEDVGYTVDSSRLYLKQATTPSYLHCATATCTTIEYKSGTRAHIESLGYDIVGNFGDQFSDLTGGFADKDYKMPNPMYFLP